MWISKKNLEGALNTVIAELLNGKLASTKAGEVINLTDRLVALTKEKTALTEQVETIKADHKLADLELKHLLKMKEEKDAVANEKMKVQLEGEYQKKEMALMKEYFDKTMANIDKAKGEINEIYKQILERLPNVTALLTRDVKDK